MKARKGIWKIVLLFSFVLMFSCLTPARASGESGAPVLRIEANNLSFNDSVYMKYAVSFENVAKENVSLLVWMEPQNDYTIGNKSFQLSSVGTATVSGKTCLVFDFKELSAKQMTDDVYARAYARVDGTDYYSPVQKYSVLQYAYNKLGKTAPASDNEKLKSLLTQMLNYGAAAQTYFNYATERLATDAFYQVKVTGGKLSDQCANGLYKVGTQITLSAPSVDENGNAFLYWTNDAGARIGTTTYTVEAKNVTLKPVYSGLEIESNGDGTACVVGRGRETDPALVIPAYTASGNTVTEIDSSAFAGEDIQSVTIPVTVTSIGRKAFYGCSELVDVYYAGSEEQWNGIEIGYNNQSLSDAHIHYNALEAEPEYQYEHDYKWEDYQFQYSAQLNGCVLAGYSGNDDTVYVPAAYQGNPVVAIGEAALSVKEIKTVILPETIVEIRAHAFSASYNLEYVNIPDSVRRIDKRAFASTKISNISVPDDIQHIGNDAFVGCDRLNYSVWGGGRYIGNQNNPYLVFIGRDASTIEDFHENTKIITGDYASLPRYSQEELILPGGLRELNGSTIRFTQIRRITIPVSIQRIDPYAFYYGRTLELITYQGTTAQWRKINRVSDDGSLTSTSKTVTVNCTDGTTSTTIFYQNS